MEYFSRKTTRLKGYDYSSSGYYFVTVCTKNKQKLLGSIVWTGLLDGPTVQYSSFGEIVNRQLKAMSDFYENLKLEKYVIMPNHIHLLIHITESHKGPSGRPVPTNSMIGKFVGSFKRFCNKEFDSNIWQFRSHDHIIRGEQDYKRIWQYIENNPAKWADDCFYVE